MVGVACQCSKCSKMLSCPRKRREHEEKCNGATSLQCPKCWATFSNRKQKSRHCLANACVAVPKPAAVNITTGPITANTNIDGDHNTVNTTIDNSVHIDNSFTDNSVTTNNITNRYIFNFPDIANILNDHKNTDTHKVVREMIRDPAFFQLAHELGIFDEAVILLMHYSYIIENRNVIAVEKHGTYVYVYEEGLKIAMDKTEFVEQSIRRVQEISQNPDIKRIMKTKTEPTIADISCVDDADTFCRRYKRLKQRHITVHANKGYFRHFIKVPVGKPYVARNREVVKLVIEICKRYTDNNKRFPEAIDFGAPAMLYCKRFEYTDGHYFVASGGLNDGFTREDIISFAKESRCKIDRQRVSQPIPLHPAQEDRDEVGWEMIDDDILLGNIQYALEKIKDGARQHLKFEYLKRKDASARERGYISYDACGCLNPENIAHHCIYWMRNNHYPGYENSSQPIPRSPIQ